MRNPTVYLKMRVLGAVDMAEGNTERKRMQAVSQMSFTDEDGQPRQFTWRTISAWLCRYRKYGVTVMENKPRSDKGKTRKVGPEVVQEAIDAVLPKVHGRAPKRSLLYRLCIGQGWLARSQAARTTFYRLARKNHKGRRTARQECFGRSTPAENDPFFENEQGRAAMTEVGGQESRFFGLF